MRDSTSPFDQQTDNADELTREFWGEKSAWVSDERRAARTSGRTMQIRPSGEQADEYRLDHTPTSMRAVRDGIAAFKPKRRQRGDSTGPVQRTRQHGVVTGATPAVAPEPTPTGPRRPSADQLAHSNASIADLASGRFDYDDGAYDLSDLDEPIPVRRSAPVPSASNRAGSAQRREREHDHDLVPLTPVSFGDRFGLSAVDPAVIRVGIVLLALVLALPLALAMRGDDSSGAELPGNTVPAATETVAVSGGAPAGTGAPAAADPTIAPTDPEAAESTANELSSDAAPTPIADPSDDEVAAASESSGVVAAADTRTAAADETTEAAAGSGAAAVVDEPAERITPDCSLDYTAAAGDSWYRIAGEAGVTPDELLAQNMASLDTVILPGDEICLPAGSTVPTPPTTAAAPTTTEAPTTAAPTTTSAPTTTTAPTTTVAERETYSPDEVKALIRETWPEDQHEKALQVAWRESNYIETADNGWCCVGVFQIYWTVHQGWLDDYGINSRDDLKNARKNIAAAYALYQSSGGWGPWGG